MNIRGTALLIALSASASIRAEHTVPSADVLTAMGLGELKFLTDQQASTIRGRGFKSGDILDGFEHFEASKAAFAEHVAEFRDRIEDHTFAGAAKFAKWKDGFAKDVAKYHAKVGAFQQRIH